MKENWIGFGCSLLAVSRDSAFELNFLICLHAFKGMKKAHFSASESFIMFPGKDWRIDIKNSNLLQEVTIDKPLAPLTPEFGYFFLK